MGMNDEDAMDLVVLDQYDHQGQGRQRGRSARRSTRSGHSSLLWMIQYEMGQLSDPQDINSPTNLQLAAKRLVQLILFGKEDVALRAMQLYLAYSEGEPRQLIQFEIVQAAKTIAENRNLDAQALIERAERIAAEAGI